MLKAIATVGIFTIVLVLTANSATFENRDNIEYNYQITTNNQRAYGRIVSDATVYDICDNACRFCEYGCDLTLLKTGQTIRVQRDDHIAIENGIMEASGVGD